MANASLHSSMAGVPRLPYCRRSLVSARARQRHSSTDGRRWPANDGVVITYINGIFHSVPEWESITQQLQALFGHEVETPVTAAAAACCCGCYLLVTFGCFLCNPNYPAIVARHPWRRQMPFCETVIRLGYPPSPNSNRAARITPVADSQPFQQVRPFYNPSSGWWITDASKAGYHMLRKPANHTIAQGELPMNLNMAPSFMELQRCFFVGSKAAALCKILLSLSWRSAPPWLQQ